MRTLVFATRAIAQTVWTQELAEWEHLRWLVPHARSLVGLSTSERERIIFDERGSRLDIINYEHIGWLAKALEARKVSLGQYYDTVVCDEITKLKNPSGKRFKLMARMVHPDHVPYFWGLTGSPASEGYTQVWAPMYLVDYGHRLGYTYQQYLDEFFVSLGERWYTKQGAQEQIQAKLRDVVLTLNAEDYDVLPAVLHNPRTVPLESARLRAKYAELEREMYIELERGAVVAANGGVLIGKCLQFTSGAMYINPEQSRSNEREWEELHSLKMDALESLYEELNGQRLVVAVQFKHEIPRIQARFPEAVHMHSGNVVEVSARWNVGQIPMLLAHPLSCGHGLNLQQGGGDICFFSLPYSLEQFEQTIGRLARPGQLKPVVTAHALLMDGTVDFEAWRALQSKQGLQQTLKSAMSARSSGTQSPLPV